MTQRGRSGAAGRRARRLFRRPGGDRHRPWRHGRQDRRRRDSCAVQCAARPRRASAPRGRLRGRDPRMGARRTAGGLRRPRSGFGRTRVGVETGLAIVGDVGISAKLDYTAHGDAVNLTARLEAANKELGSTICVGPVAAARCDPASLRPLGVIEVRGRDRAARGVRAVAGGRARPPGASATWQAFRSDRERPCRAIELFEALAARTCPMIRCRAVWRSGCVSAGDAARRLFPPLPGQRRIRQKH